MIGKKITLLLAAALILIFAGYVASVQNTEGVVVKIEGSYLSVLDGVGQMVTITGYQPEVFADIMVGDKVVVKDGRVFKELRLASAKTYPNYLNELNLGSIPTYSR